MSASMAPIFCQQCGAPVTAVDGPTVRCAFCGTVMHRMAADSPLVADVASTAADDRFEEAAPTEVLLSALDVEVITERIADGNRLAATTFGTLELVALILGGATVGGPAILWLVTTTDRAGRWQVLAAGALALLCAMWMLYWLTWRAEQETQAP